MDNFFREFSPTYPQLIHSGILTTQGYPQLVHRVMHRLCTGYPQQIQSYPQVIHNVYTGNSVGQNIELITVYAVKPIESIVYTESPRGTVYAESHSIRRVSATLGQL